MKKQELRKKNERDLKIYEDLSEQLMNLEYQLATALNSIDDCPSNILNFDLEVEHVDLKESVRNFSSSKLETNEPVDHPLLFSKSSIANHSPFKDIFKTPKAQETHNLFIDSLKNLETCSDLKELKVEISE
jgi:hypothetical protein